MSNGWHFSNWLHRLLTFCRMYMSNEFTRDLHMRGGDLSGQCFEIGFTDYIYCLRFIECRWTLKTIRCLHSRGEEPSAQGMALILPVK